MLESKKENANTPEPETASVGEGPMEQWEEFEAKSASGEHTARVRLRRRVGLRVAAPTSQDSMEQLQYAMTVHKRVPRPGSIASLDDSHAHLDSHEAPN